MHDSSITDHEHRLLALEHAVPGDAELAHGPEAQHFADTPMTPDQARTRADHLIDESRQALATQVTPRLEQAHTLIADTLRTMPTLPGDVRSELMEMLYNTETRLACLNIGNVFPHCRLKIQVPVGSTRMMKLQDGTDLPVQHKHAYGEITDTRAPDGDPVDIIAGTKAFTAVYAIKQPGDGEMKYVLGADSDADAVTMYRDDHPELRADQPVPVQAMSIEEFDRNIVRHDQT